MYLLDKRIFFPDVECADHDGLLAIGGDLRPERLDLAYQMGIFPWYDEAPILWWTPDPRFVLFPEDFVLSKNMARKLRNGNFDFRMDYDFESVMRACQRTPRKGESGTWIQDEMIQSYLELHTRGIAHSASIYIDDILVAGLYGLRVGEVFCGESMFHTVTDMSKVCFGLYVQRLQEEGVKIIDCQVHTDHLESLGARFIPRVEYCSYLPYYQ